MAYDHEIDALGRWVYQVAGLKSHRLSNQTPQVTRPVILWEAPNRRKVANISRYMYQYRISQYGVLYVSNLDQLTTLVAKLEADIEDRGNDLPMFENETATAAQVGRLRNVRLDVNTASTVDIPIIVRYDVYYNRLRPAPAPAANVVGNRINVE